MGNIVASLKDIWKDYALGKKKITALYGVSLDIYEGEFSAIMGPSGSGKTTILNLIACIDSPTKGNIYILGKDIKLLNDKERAKIRNKYIGYVFQSFNLIPTLTVYENVEYPLLLGKIKITRKIKEEILSLLDEVGIGKYANQKPDELSGGERQRVAIARALITRPKIVIADEPTANLDHKTGTQIIKLMLHLNKRYKTTFLFSTHSSLLSSYANRIIYILDGKIVKEEIK